MRYYEPYKLTFPPMVDTAPIDNNLWMGIVKEQLAKEDKLDKDYAELGPGIVVGGNRSKGKAEKLTNEITRLKAEYAVDIANKDAKTATQKLYKIKSLMNSPEALAYMEDYKRTQELGKDKEYDPVASVFNSRVHDGKNWIEAEDYRDLSVEDYKYNTSNYFRDFKPELSVIQPEINSIIQGSKYDNEKGQYYTEKDSEKTYFSGYDLYMRRLSPEIQAMGNKNLSGFHDRPSLRIDMQNSPDYQYYKNQVENDPDGNTWAPDPYGNNPLEHFLADKVARSASPYYRSDTYTTNTDAVQDKPKGKSGAISEEGITTGNAVVSPSSAIKEARQLSEGTAKNENNVAVNNDQVKTAVKTAVVYQDPVNLFNENLRDQSFSGIKKLENAEQTEFRTKWKALDTKIASGKTITQDDTAGLFKSNNDIQLSKESEFVMYQKIKGKQDEVNATANLYKQANEEIVNDFLQKPEAVHNGVTINTFKRDASGLLEYDLGSTYKNLVLKKEAEQAATTAVRLAEKGDRSDEGIYTPGVPLPHKEKTELYNKTYSDYISARDTNYKNFITFSNNENERRFGLSQTNMAVTSLATLSETVPGDRISKALEKAFDTAEPLGILNGALTPSGENIRSEEYLGEQTEDKPGTLGLVQKIIPTGVTISSVTGKTLIQVKVIGSKVDADKDPLSAYMYVPAENVEGHDQFTQIIRQADIQKRLFNTALKPDTEYVMPLSVTDKNGTVSEVPLTYKKLRGGKYGEEKYAVMFPEDLIAEDPTTGKLSYVTKKEDRGKFITVDNLQTISQQLSILTTSYNLKSLTVDEVNNIGNDAASRNNPSGLKKNGVFESFNSMEEGLNATINDLAAKQAGRSVNTIPEGPNQGKKLLPTSPLVDLIRMWAPTGNGTNTPDVYAERVAKILGVGIDTPISTIPTRDLAKAMIKQESGKAYNKLYGTPSGKEVSLSTISGINIQDDVSQPVVDETVLPYVEDLITKFPDIWVVGAKRTEEKNNEPGVNGVENSKHLIGKALDIKSNAEGKEMYKYLNNLSEKELSALGIVQIIDETKKPGAPHYHIEFI